MIAFALALTLAADAPRMEKLPGGDYLLNAAGYARLEQVTTQLQLDLRASNARVRELETFQGEGLRQAFIAGLVVGVVVTAAVAVGVSR